MNEYAAIFSQKMLNSYFLEEKQLNIKDIEFIVSIKINLIILKQILKAPCLKNKKKNGKFEIFLTYF